MNYRVAFRHAKLLLATNGRDHNATSQFLGIYISLLEPSLMQSIPDGTAFPDLCFHITIFMS